MKAMTARLTKVAGHLSGRQMALIEIRRELEFGTMMQSIRNGLSRIGAEPPLGDRIGEAIERATVWDDSAAMWRTIRTHQREALFLMHLWNGCNCRVAHEDELLRANGAHLRSKIVHLLLEGQTSALADLCREARGRKRASIGKQGKKISTPAPTFKSELERFNYHITHMDEWIRGAFDLATGLLIELYHTRLAIEWLSEHYFDGEPVLFLDLQASLRGLLATIIRNVRLLNRAVARSYDHRYFVEYLETGTVDDEHRPPKVDIRAVKSAAAVSLRAVVKGMIDSALAEAHTSLAENEEAAKIHRARLDDTEVKADDS